MSGWIEPCGRCGRPTRLEELDSLPSGCLWWLVWRWAPDGLFFRLIARAGDFDRMLCRRCYGRRWRPM